MSIKRGVVTEVTSTSARSISVKSTLPLALVLTSSVVSAGIYGFDSPKDALEFFNKDNALKNDKGNLEKYISLGDDMFNLTVPTVVSIASIDKVAANTKTNIIEAIYSLKTAGSLTSYKPDIIAVATKDFDMDINNALDSVCKSIKARTFIDLKASSNSQARERREGFGSDRVTVIKSSVLIFNTKSAQKEEYDSGVLLAYLRCVVDGSSSTGYAKSISNRVLNISGVVSPSEFYAGALDQTDPLTESQIMSFIHHKGFRTWEYATTSADPIWQDARRVRIFDLCCQAVIDGIFFAVDKDIGELAAAKDSLRGFMNGLVGDSVMAGFKVELDTQRTTKERISAGEFYFIVEAQEMPSPRLIHITFNRVDKYSDVIYKTISGE